MVDGIENVGLPEGLGLGCFLEKFLWNCKLDSEKGWVGV